MPFYRKPSFQILAAAILLAGTYAYEFLGGIPLATVVWGIGFDLILLLLLSQFFLFFYAQFVAPVRSARDRVSIFGRLLLHWRGAHGPAVFVQNGRIVERRSEQETPGPGLLWLDSASAVVTRRSDAGAARALGPGVHFLASKEKIAVTFSLSPQSSSIGPEEGESIFDPLDGESGEARVESSAARARRMSVAARTRDGNEVVPRIGLVFKLDANPAPPGAPGSRFGFNRDAVERAARAEGVAAGHAEGKSRVPWNQLPSLIAVDLWREYVSKFTLDELFTPTFPSPPNLLQPDSAGAAQWSEPQSPRQDGPIDRLLVGLNDGLELWLDRRGVQSALPAQEPYARGREAKEQHPRIRGYTALEIVRQMMRARMTKAVVPVLDDCGRPAKGRLESEEYKRLKERGLVVLDVEIEAVQFDPGVEEQIVRNWNTSWFEAAKGDRRHIEQLELLSVQAGRQKALREHAARLAEAIETDDPKTVPAAVRSLVGSARDGILVDERLRGRSESELDGLSQIQRWAEIGDRD